MKKWTIGLAVSVCALSFYAGVFSLSVFAETATLNDKIAAVAGVNAVYDGARSKHNGGIVADGKETYANGGSRFVVFQYDLTAGSSTAETVKYGFQAGTTALNKGDLQGSGDSYDEGYGNLFRYATGSSPFLSYVGNTVTAVFDRATAECAVYASRIGDEPVFDGSLGLTVSGAEWIDVDLSKYYVACEKSKGQLLSGRASEEMFVQAAQNSTLAGLALGGGTATLQNIRAFDEYGNALAVTLGNDFCAQPIDAPTGCLSTGANTDTALSAPVNLAFEREGGADTAKRFDDAARSGIYHESDRLLTRVLPENYGARLTTNGQAAVLHFADENYKAQIGFGRTVAVDGLDSVTFRAYVADGSAGELYLFSVDDTRSAVGQNCVRLNDYLPKIPTGDYTEITLSAAALAPIADGNGNLSGVQVCYLSAGETNYFVLDEITYAEKRSPNVYMTAGAVMRLSTPSGLGFLTNIDYGYYQALVERYGENAVATGTLIVPQDKLPESGLTHESLRAGNVTHLDVPNVGFLNESTAQTDGVLRFRGSIVKILEQNLARKFVGRGYVAVTENGETQYFYAEQNDNARSVREVAQKAYETVSDVYDESNRCVHLITYENHPDFGKYSPYTREQLQALEEYIR